MEAEVDKLELMFQKADSDLDYLQYRLEYEIKTNHSHSAGEVKNAGTILKELSAIKSRYQALCARFKEVSVEQKETKSCICALLNKTMTTIQELQKQTNLELVSLYSTILDSKQSSCFSLLSPFNYRNVPPQWDSSGLYRNYLTLLTEEEKAVTEQLKSHMPDLI
ncbi:Spindle and kinetochore-associated protein 2 [Apodemus speciosus]|uniref:Protein FAM33A n=1 Tax=Apodemus speciosus TaxID=105296 RepID=A0ABQ0FBK1_APOSI